MYTKVFEFIAREDPLIFGNLEGCRKNPKGGTRFIWVGDVYPIGQR